MNSKLEAYKIITKVFVKNIYSDKLLNKVKKKDTSFTDVEYTYLLVKGVIKQKLNLEYIASQFTEKEKFKQTDEKIKLLIYLGLYQLRYVDSIPAHAAINETVEIAKTQFNTKIANFVNAILREYSRNPEIKYPEKVQERLAYQYSYPPDLIENWLALWGEEATEYLCLFFNENPKLSIRVNQLATTPKKLLKYFKRRKVLLQPSNVSKMVLQTIQANQVLNDVAFSEGYYSIQDASAALVVELMQPEPKDVILDLFSAPGGKTTYIAEMMNDDGEVFAVDKIPVRIKKVKQNVARLQLKTVKTFGQDAFQFGPVAPDVPCSGWGVMQKKAELRWQYHQDLPNLLKLQAKAIKQGSLFVKEGGYLIYSTCTLNPKENEEQVNDFLSKHNDFELIPADSCLDSSFVENGFLKIMPFQFNSDGVFAAKMRKKEIS